MRGNVYRRVPMQVRGDSAYAASGRARLNFNDVQPIGNGLESYVAGVELVQDMVFTHDNAGAINLPEEIAHRVLDSIQCRMPGGHTFFDLGAQAGFAIYCLTWALTGRRPNSHGAGGNISLTNGANTAVRVKTYLPFQFLGNVKPHDANIPLRELQETAIELGWVNGAAAGVFDTGANNERIVSGALRASIDLVGRGDTGDAGEWRYAPRFSVVSMELSGVEERLPLSGEVLHALLEIPVHADQSITVNRITDAERDLVTFMSDGMAIIDREDVRDLCTRWNRGFAQSRDEELPHHETDASPFLPLVMPPTRPYLITQCPAPPSDPLLRVTGTDSTPRVVWLSSDLASLSKVLDAARAGRVRTPEGFAKNPESFLDAKTASKNEAAQGDLAFNRLPIRLRQTPSA